MGGYLDRTYHGPLGEAPYHAYMPHGIVGWNPAMGQQATARVKAAGDRIATMAARLPPHRSLQWCLNRAEGIASSDVEGISTTLRSLSLLESLRAEHDLERNRRDTQALGAARLTARATDIGRRADTPITAADLREMHLRLFDASSVPFEPGRLRSDDIWVGAPGATPLEALYVAPPAEHVGPLVDDLMEFVSAHDLLHPLLKAAVAHLQFETIHPFPDGNGRVGRALIHCVLQRNWPETPPIPLSAAIAEHKQAYYQSLRPYQTYTGDPESPIRAACAEVAAVYIADAAEVACDYTEATARAVADMHAEWDGLNLRPHSAAAAVLEVMATMPAAGVEHLCATTGRSPNAVRRGLRRLVAAGAVSETRDEHTGRRVFEVSELLQIVDHRQKLLTRCWQARQGGFRLSPAELLTEWRHDITATA
ncbi:MAG: Fic family protein [Acidimicrobiaceae bacterium]|nr:Fic family protein [Acidimicrobiia bacterium]MCY4493347.1 Fic family protein [Acidimicrobiaceae bacterium]